MREKILAEEMEILLMHILLFYMMEDILGIISQKNMY
jgi:hypothetical protein